MIGVGTDIIEVERVKTACERHGERFLKRVFTEGERAYCMQMKNPYPHLAARFAAKEAVSKAFTTGIGEELNWTSIEVIKGSREEPIIHLDDKGQKLLEHVGATGVLITLAHTANYGTAVAVLVK
ncbi:MAG: holo-ACP synthase [Verrucomicrobiota bacterium]|nr:holo-ACP synthase [Verrucomicrobiota bacterium]